MRLAHKIIIAILSLTTIASLLFAFIQGQNAIRFANEAQASRQVAEEQRDRAVRAEKIADLSAKEAQKSMERASIELLECQNQLSNK